MPSTQVGVEGPITVVVVDEVALVRAALRQALAGSSVHLVGEATSGEDALRIASDLRPDVVVMDLRLPRMSGVEAIRRLSELAPSSRVLVLTRGEHERVVEAIVAGATGYIVKTAPPEAIVAAIRSTAAGESVLSPQVAGRLIERIRERDIPVTATSDNAADAIRAVLTERELEVFRRLASGKSNPQIAHELSLSTNTIANHIASILAKLQLENRIQAAVQAVRSGMA